MSPDKRQHRGAHPADEKLFAPDQFPRLRLAVSELSWLLGRGYAGPSAVKLVGDRHNLTERQRLAVARAACADNQLGAREERVLPPAAVRGEALAVDGFNLIITAEAALGGGLLLLCRDGCVRDLSSVHGSYRSVDETESAIRLIGSALSELGAGPAKWFLDRPISNSGRLAEKLRRLAADSGWAWEVEVVFNPDAALLSCGAVAVTSDSLILDGPVRWLNFSRHLVETHIPQAWVVDLT